MFEPTKAPRVFALPPGADFPADLAKGLIERMDNQPPHALARVTVLVNTRRMQRRLKMLLAEGPPRLLPRIGLVTDLDTLLPQAALPPPVSALRRRLELARLVGALMDKDPQIAPRAAAVDLADSLATLMDEMQGEGVAPDVLQTLDVTDQSGHWDRSLRFLSIVRQYTDESDEKRLDTEARRRLAAELLLRHWNTAPPTDPIIVAGSTGSRATTSLLMQAVANLPQGAVVLPGFDFDLPANVWHDLTKGGLSPLGSEDHPQYRFATFLDTLNLAEADVVNWHGTPERAHRNALISLSLRPAPVTDKWLSEGPELGDLIPRTENIALIEAAQAKDEALSIAVALRKAVEDGKTAALITPDRTLGRRVAAALRRWDIEPDDSAGRPLSLTAPGRFLRQVMGLIGQRASPTHVIALLKHPLAHASKDRGPHLLLTRELELFLRRQKTAIIDQTVITQFAKARSDHEKPWCAWLAGWLDTVAQTPSPRLADCLDFHVTASQAMASGLDTGAGELWEQSAGRDALAVITKIRAEADFPDALPFHEYTRLLDRILAAENTRSHDTARTDVMIWGTLEARVQGADLVVLGGLNEGVWPERPAADPWLNRSLRRQAGLLLPERQIGLAAHDYQQAVAAKEVILARSRRDADSETVPSRWLSRLTNLLDGLKDQNGPEALSRIRARGQTYLELAERIDIPLQPVASETRPDPAPPVDVRPVDFTVTEIERLIRDPYAIYARHVLKLRALDPLEVTPDARLKGEIFHKVMEEAFSIDADFSDPEQAEERLRFIAARHFENLPWPAVRAHWSGQLESIAAHLVAEEQMRRQVGRPVALERKGRIEMTGTRFSVRGKADRIDRLIDGNLAIYDYKTGKPPSRDQVRYFDRQLPIEAVMAEYGGFQDVPSARVAHVAHIGLGRSPETSLILLAKDDDIDFRTVTIAAELALLLASFDNDAKGYPSRRAMEELRFPGDYDHLARFGEWDETSDPVTERLP